jgi:Zn-dependent protease
MTATVWKQLADLGQVTAHVVIVLIPVLLSLTWHEFAHALTASWLGDRTAERSQRLSFHPRAHADPIGTVLVPLMILILNGVQNPVAPSSIPFVGWGKPVPFKTAELTRLGPGRLAAILVVAAGPLANLLLALVAAAAYAHAIHRGYASAWPEPLVMFVELVIQVNVGLAVLNLLPLGPLDAFRLVTLFASPKEAGRLYRFNFQVGWLAVLAIILFAHRPFAALVDVVIDGIRWSVGL